MGVLLLTCPTTGQQFSTGLQVSAEEIGFLPDVEASTDCPCCGGRHLWRPKQAEYVEADPTSPEIQSTGEKECLEKSD
jgi:hypothetical protein